MARNRAGLVSSLQSVLGKNRIALDPANRLLYSRDMMTGTTLDMKAKSPPHLPDLICWPETPKEISGIVRIADRHRIPVIAFGAGSGVSGGTLPLHGGIIIDLKRLQKVGTVEEKNGRFFVTAQTGIVGERLERELNAQGFTLGHFPSSIGCATLGGYLAARSAGQLSSKYGKIEDMVEEVEVVLPNGEIIPFEGSVKKFPGIRTKDLFVGTEGCLGIMTQARLKVYPLPSASRYRGISFNHLEDALKTIREIMQSGLRPSVVRLYDPLDTLLLQHSYEETGGFFQSLLKRSIGKIPLPRETLKKGFRQFISQNPYWLQKIISLLPTEVLLILGFEGDPVLIQTHEKVAQTICRKYISRDLGEKPGLHWLKHRYSVSFKMPQIFEQDCFVDTIEVASTWDKLIDLYKRMKEGLEKNSLVFAHFSHAYPEGCSIYFTIIGRTGSPKTDRALYNRLWTQAMEGCLEAGGTISHHHGIGLLKAKFMKEELGGALAFYKRLKKRLDPHGILNPGKMGLDLPLAPSLLRRGLGGGLDHTSLLVTVPVTASLKTIESKLREKGFTLGYLPVRGGKRLTFKKILDEEIPNLHALRYGEIDDLCMAVKCRLKEGKRERIQTKKVPRAATGPDFKKIFIGSRGLYGDLLEATLRICPLPETKKTMRLTWKTARQRAEILRRFWGSGIRPLQIEMRSRQMIVSLAGPEEIVKAEYKTFL